jgi:plastocyanin
MGKIGMALGVALATLGASGLLAWTCPSAAQAEEVTVKIDNFTFAPQQLKVKAGTTVTWINEDDIPHALASSTKTFKSKTLDTDDKFSFTFTTPGSYAYFCSLHPHMTASIVVEAETGSLPPQGNEN